jgi:hypothetical protein|tara:strand:- start:7958 stop:8449 length:492 start_codon:yes stop_codon:yes gene_type:complete
MKKILLILVMVLLSLTTIAQQIDRLAGPRVGVTFLTPGFMSEELETSMITQYGWQWESRFADNGNIAGLVEWVVVVGGMERQMFLPSISSLVGVRTGEGMEYAVGPNLSATGINMVFTIGKNFKSGDLNFPVNLAFVPNGNVWGEDEESGARISLMVGFNMGK